LIVSVLAEIRQDVNFDAHASPAEMRERIHAVIDHCVRERQYKVYYAFDDATPVYDRLLADALADSEPRSMPGSDEPTAEG
jgi:hypothetical protein